MSIETKIVITLGPESDAVLLAQLVDLAQKAGADVYQSECNGGPVDPPEPPPVEEEFFWNNNKTMEDAVDEVYGLKLSYVRMSAEKAFLWVPDSKNVAVPSQPSEFGSDTATARTYTKPGQIICVLRNPEYTAPGKTEPDEKIYNANGLGHIKNLESEKRPFPIALDGGTRCFIPIWEQSIDGRILNEHPDRRAPLLIKAEDVVEIMDF